MREVQLRDAKANLSAVVDVAIEGKPAVITRHRKKQAVVLSYEEWPRLSQVPSFGCLLMAASVRAGDLPARNRAKLRRTDFLRREPRWYQRHSPGLAQPAGARCAR